MRPGSRVRLPALLLAAAMAVTGAAGAEPGAVVAIGGGERPPSLMAEIVRLAGGPESRFVVLPMASAEPEATGAFQREQLEAAGAGSVEVLLFDRAAADEPATAERIAAATGFFLSGGDQRRLADVLVGTAFEAALAARHRAGAVVAGTSAGAAILSGLMITGDELRPARDEEPFATIAAGNVVTRPGLGLFPGAVVDQHFVARRRHNRLVSLVLEHPDLLGIGVDESTAAVWTPPGRLRVAGDGQVVIYDASAATGIASGVDGRLAAAGIALHVLVPGQVFDLTERALVP